MVIPVYCGPIQLPKFPDKDFTARECLNKRMNAWYKRYPHGHIEVTPSPIKYFIYDSFSEVFGCRIFYQEIKKSKDASFLEGNYETELVFYFGEKDYGYFPLQYFHFEKWYKPVFYEWAATNEIPIEMMEEVYHIPFREQWKWNNERRKKEYEEWKEFEKFRAEYDPFFCI